MNIRDLDKAFSEIFNEIEQMNEEQIKKIDFEIEKNINKYRKNLLNYNSERKSISIDTTHEDNKYIDELKNNIQHNRNECQTQNYGRKKLRVCQQVQHKRGVNSGRSKKRYSL